MRSRDGGRRPSSGRRQPIDDRWKPILPEIRTDTDIRFFYCGSAHTSATPTATTTSICSGRFSIVHICESEWFVAFIRSPMRRSSRCALSPGATPTPCQDIFKTFASTSPKDYLILVEQRLVNHAGDIQERVAHTNNCVLHFEGF